MADDRATVAATRQDGPRVVLADIDILVDTPLEVTASGYADLLGKVTAGAD